MVSLAVQSLVVALLCLPMMQSPARPHLNKRKSWPLQVQGLLAHSGSCHSSGCRDCNTLNMLTSTTRELSKNTASWYPWMQHWTRFMSMPDDQQIHAAAVGQRLQLGREMAQRVQDYAHVSLHSCYQPVIVAVPRQQVTPVLSETHSPDAAGHIALPGILPDCAPAKQPCPGPASGATDGELSERSPQQPACPWQGSVACLPAGTRAHK